MSPDELAERVRSIRDLTREVPTTATAEELWASAWTLAQGLDPANVELAAACYLLRVLKDNHRDAVAAVERKAARRPISKLKELHRGDMTAEEVEHLDAYYRDQEEVDAEFSQHLRGLLTRYSASLKMRWTAELLESTFALPDGTLVTWGTASVEDHESRRDMLMTNAKGSMQAAARHQAAITDLTSTSRGCLRDLVTAA